MRITTGMLAIIAFVIVSALGMFTFLIYVERDISPLANLLLTFVAVATGAGFTVAKTGTVQKAVEEVKANVNGRMTQLIEKVAAADAVATERQITGIEGQPQTGGQRTV